MRARQIFEYALVELNKRNAPSLLLEDYNYFINKAVLQYINKMYNLYDINQQKTDDLRVLKSSALLIPLPTTRYAYNNGMESITPTLFGKIYEVELPDDYLHILNCVVEYNVLKNFKCYNADTTWHQGANRLTADMFSQIINNYYLRPSYKQPYFYIHNVNVDNLYPTLDSQTPVTEADGETRVPIKDWNVAENRYGNRSKIRMEIRYGKDNTIFELNKVFIDYIKSPQFIRLTQEQVDEVEDTSQLLEFPDYVAQEIVNDLVKLLMENSSDPRLQTNIPVNQTIANPAQQDQEQKRR